MPTATIDKKKSFRFWAPFVNKSIHPVNHCYIINGYASTGSLDYQGERVDPVGLDLSYFKRYGWIDYEHNPELTIGSPIQCGVNDKGFYVKAKLFADNPIVKKIINLVKEIRKAGLHRHLGYSIEGQVKQRDPNDQSIISSILITGVAVTKNPANTDASWSLVQKSIWAHNYHHDDTKLKSLMSGYGDSPQTQQNGAALRPQSLAYKLHNISYGLSNLKPIVRLHLMRKTLKYLNSHYHKDIYSHLLALQIASGCSISRASKNIQIAKKSLNKESED